MYQRILVPLDQSKAAEQIIPYARLLRRALGSAIELLQVIEPPAYTTGDLSYNAYLDQVSAALRTEAEHYLEELAESLRTAGTPVAWTVRQGDPATIIKEEAEIHPNTLIALCTHGRSGLSRWWLGSTADKVCHACSNPLLVLRSPEGTTGTGHTSITGCSVLLDGSELAEQILPHVAALAQAIPLHVTLVRVIPEVDSHYWELFTPNHERDREGAARDYLENIRRQLASQGISDVELSLLHGHPANTLAELARHDPQNLMALTTQGLGSSGIYRWTMGSVAQRIMSHAQGPVLLARTQDILPQQNQ